MEQEHASTDAKRRKNITRATSIARGLVRCFIQKSTDDLLNVYGTLDVLSTSIVPSEVPEPSTAALASLGFAALLGRQRRR
jgi:MYXO-CTERM domain-containing protein